ncbi:MAG: hypothetical protein H7330_14905 [Hymenobacteraceae bacterium]|nr:hypothetical protein [Hymenobacteraceae bacterium]
MRAALSRVGATVRADFLIRLRRTSTVVIFLLLSAVAYFWVPAPSTGNALLIINGQRALLNSAAVGVGSASLAAILIGLIGFYVISNALRTDLTTRCGFVIAATPVRRLEYVAGKFLGNLTFLVVFTAGYMLVSMAMVLVRGEAPLEPLVFAAQYLVLLPPTLAFVSALAILFEATPVLAGRVGDVLYFFVWVAAMSLVPILTSGHRDQDLDWLVMFDFSGLGYLISYMNQVLHTDNVAIGASPFDAAKGTVLFHGLPITANIVAMRLGVALVPAVLLLPAATLFHRFDPGRVRVRDAKGGTGLLARLNGLTKPLTRVLYALPLPGRPGSLLGAAFEEARLTLAAFPLFTVAALGFGVAALVVPLAVLRGGLLPGAFVVAAIGLAEIGCREGQHQTTTLLYAMPRVREQFVLWKFTAALVVALVLFGLPLGRLALSQPGALPALGVGVVFIAALATALAVVSRTPKTFLILFLLLWYASLNAKGQLSALDYAGLQGSATPTTTIGYLVVSMVLIGGAHLWHRWRLT